MNITMTPYTDPIEDDRDYLVLMNDGIDEQLFVATRAGSDWIDNASNNLTADGWRLRAYCDISQIDTDTTA